MKALRRAAASSLLAWSVVLVSALAYPIVVLAGGAPSFPERSECVFPATRDGEITLVFGYFDSVVRATSLLDRVRSVGYTQADIESDGGCGRVKVAVHGYTTLSGARDALGEARSVGLRPTLEQVS